MHRLLAAPRRLVHRFTPHRKVRFFDIWHLSEWIEKLQQSHFFRYRTGRRIDPIGQQFGVRRQPGGQHFDEFGWRWTGGGADSKKTLRTKSVHGARCRWPTQRTVRFNLWSRFSKLVVFRNEFSFLILVKYLDLFQFSTTRIDAALREFLSRVELRGESSARERLLRVFSARYLECNPSIFESLDEVHTLTCALLLLNSDLHGPNNGRKMTARDFITNIGHTGCTYKRDILKTLYQSIKDNAIALQQWVSCILEQYNGRLFSVHLLKAQLQTDQ